MGGGMKKYLLICCMLVSASAAAQVYKCTVNGKTVYADNPCDSKAVVVPIMRGPTLAESNAARTSQATLKAEMDRRSSIRAAIDAGEPRVSMTEQELYDAMGRPNRVNAGNYSGSRQDQLIYDRYSRTWYVYLTDGIVTSIQNSERIGR